MPSLVCAASCLASPAEEWVASMGQLVACVAIAQVQVVFQVVIPRHFQDPISV